MFGWSVDRLVQRRRRDRRVVDRPLDQRLHDRLVRVVDAEDDLVDRRGAVPVVRVGLHPEVLALLPLDQVERARDHGVGEVLEALQLLDGEAAPDVLGQDQVVAGQARDQRRPVRLPHDRLVVDGLDALGVRVAVAPRADVVLDDEVARPHEVLRRDRDAVAPRQAVAEVERPRQLVVADVPADRPARAPARSPSAPGGSSRRTSARRRTPRSCRTAGTGSRS